MAEAKPVKTKRRFGRPGFPDRLPNLDLRSQGGKRFLASMKVLREEFGDRDLERLRELASLQIVFEQTSSEAIGGCVKARQDAVRLLNLISTRETELPRRQSVQAPGGHGHD